MRVEPYQFVVVGTIVWCSLTWAMGRFSGWSELARRFRQEAIVAGPSFHFQSARIGTVSYNCCFVLRVTRQGLGLSVLLPFRFGHRPLFIPWDQFRDVTVTRILWQRSIHARVGAPVSTEVSLPSVVGEYLLPKSSGSE